MTVVFDKMLNLLSVLWKTLIDGAVLFSFETTNSALLDVTGSVLKTEVLASDRMESGPSDVSTFKEVVIFGLI